MVKKNSNVGLCLFVLTWSTNVKKSPFSRTATHIFVSPGDAPATIMQYVARMETWKDNSMLAKPLAVCTYIFNSFRVIRCLSQCVSPKIAIFTTFLFPLGTHGPGAITLSVIWMEREFDAYKLSRCMCPSNYKRFWDRAIYYEKIVIFSYTLAFDAPVRRVPVGISAPPLVWKNYNGVATRRWKNFEDMFRPIRFAMIHERDGQTDTASQQRPRLCIRIAR